jgi:SWIM zinc finger
MSTLPHSVPSRMTHNVAALFGHSDDTLIAWQQACAHAADALRPQPDPERLAKALALAQHGAVVLDDDGAALVTSGVTRYHVDVDGTCSCPDAQHRGVPCKHTLAVQIHQQATASLAPSDRVAALRAATPPASTQDPRQDRLPSADRWDVKEAPASACLRLRIGDLELMYTMRDVSDAELTSRVQHLVPWVQDVLDQARERQTLLDTLRQQREAVQTASDAPALPTPPATVPQADVQELIRQAVQQALAAQQTPSNGTPPATGHGSDVQAPPSQGHGPAAANGATPFCHVHQVAMEQRSNAKGTWWSHWLASEQRYCKGK